MNHLKLAGAQWAGYTGNIGVVAFKNGVSVEPVPRAIADRLSAAMRMVEVDADGNEVEAGVAARLVHDAAQRAPLTAPLEKQTEADRQAEDRKSKAAANKAPSERFYSEDELDAIIKKGGIKALRAVAEPWGVKGRAIPDLLKALLLAQSTFINERDQKLATVTETPAAPAEPEVVEETGASAEILAAAASGNLAAALTTPEAPEGTETEKTEGTEGETPQQPADDGVTGE